MVPEEKVRLFGMEGDTHEHKHETTVIVEVSTSPSEVRQQFVNVRTSSLVGNIDAPPALWSLGMNPYDIPVVVMIKSIARIEERRADVEKEDHMQTTRRHWAITFNRTNREERMQYTEHGTNTCVQRS